MEGTLETLRYITMRTGNDGGTTYSRRVQVMVTLMLTLCLAFTILTGCETPPQADADSQANEVQLADPQTAEADLAPNPDRIVAPSGQETVSPQRVPAPTTPEVHSLSEFPENDASKHWLSQVDPVSPVEVPLTRTPAEVPTEQSAATEQESAAPLVEKAQEVDMPLLRPGMADELVSVNFDNVDIRAVLKTIGEITGINFIPHESVTGTVTVMSPTPIRLGDIYAFLQSILDVHGYATIEMDNAVKVVPKAEAARNHLQVRIGADPAFIPRTDVIVTQIIPLEYADATEMSQIIEPILSAGAQMATYPRTNSLMITDTSANIHHIAQILAQLDVEGSKEKVVLFPLRFASAQVLSEQVMRILEKNAGPAPQGGRARGPAVAENRTRILPDNRTNSLIVIASEQDVDTVTRLVEELDIQRPVGMNNVHVTYLKNADANEVSRSLEDALTSMRLTGAVESAQQIQVTPDPSTNALVIVASPPDFEVVSQIVEKLDIVREQVLVEMQILEVSEESLREIGIDWATLDDAVSDSVRGFGLTNLGTRVNFLSGTAEGLVVGAWQAANGDIKIGAILQALEKESGVNILSTPHILTSNHRKAKIIVGENRPFVTESRITETVDPVTPTVIKSFEYKDVGITLEITPHVSQGGLIRLEVDSEFTKLIEDVTTQSLDTPTTAKRTAQTVITMGSGATVVIGGLIRDDKIRTVKKVPLVGDLPLVGALFRSERDRLQKTNLLLFITPHVMSSQEDLLKMTEHKRDEMSPALEADR